jgi:hypothetical protein
MLSAVNLKISTGVLIAILIILIIFLGSVAAWFAKIQLYNSARPISSFVFLIFLMLAGYLSINHVREGGEIHVREIPAFSAIEEGIARSVEMGRPIHMTIGFGSIAGSMAPQYIAGLGVLSHVARLAGKYGARLIATLGVPEVIASVEEIVKEGYASGGRPELFDPVYNVRYLTDQQFAYASAVQAIIVRERVGANIVVGPFYAESLIFMEAGNMVGAFQVAGTARETQIPFFVLAADYAFIGEEIFAAGAMASGDKESLASIQGQDVGKLATIILIVLGILFLAFGANMSSWLNWVWKPG